MHTSHGERFGDTHVYGNLRFRPLHPTLPNEKAVGDEGNSRVAGDFVLFATARRLVIVPLCSNFVRCAQPPTVNGVTTSGQAAPFWVNCR